MARLWLALAVAVSSSAAMAGAAAAPCYRYTERLTFSGTLAIKTYPGPPNYESVAQGDRPETVLVLLLPKPVCIEANKADASGLDEAVSGVRAVQLAATRKQLGVSSGQKVRVSGTVFAAHTGHHHTPIVMSEVKAEEAR
ncbi:hypothetical protein Y590_11235 [Methylobacterium sp. AMS5]|nr:hypothetical protein Y590_11235 [Methylobacterium sp. AMS5]